MNFIFDFDGTLADSLEVFIAVFNKNVRGNNPLSPKEIDHLRGLSSRQAVRHLGVRWWQIPKLVIEGVPDFHALLPSVDTFQGLPEVLKALRERGDRLFIVTSNMGGSVDEFLARHKVKQYFTAQETGAGVFKKAKYIRRLIKNQSLRRRETVYVGDETRDIQAARMSRVKIVSVTWGFNNRKILQSRRPNFLIDQPADLLKIKL